VSAPYTPGSGRVTTRTKRTNWPSSVTWVGTWRVISNIIQPTGMSTSYTHIICPHYMPTLYAHIICPHYMSTPYRIIEFLVRVAQGRPPNDHNKYGMYPYGKPASESTQAFQEVPFTKFAHTLTVIYPFIRYDRNQWVAEKLIRDPTIPKGTKGAGYPASHPLNADGLWNINLMKRYRKFFQLCRTKLDKLFQSYEDQDGVYHGKIPAQAVAIVGHDGRARRRLTMADLDDMTDEEAPNSMDDEFED